MKELLRLEGLSYTYEDGTRALQGMDATIYEGEKLAVLGANGCGKSTLFLCLCGLLRGEGTICWKEEPYRYDKKSLQAIRRQVGLVFQEPDLQLFCMDVWQEAAFAPRNLRLKKEEVKRRVEYWLKKMDVWQLREKPPHLLSYGQKKRVSMAAVLTAEPELLILDEPTSSLDPLHSQQVMDHLEELWQEGKTLVLSTHDVDLAYRWADRVILMKEGKILLQGRPEEVFLQEETLQEAGLLMPQVLRMHRALVKGGILSKEAPIPRSMEQLEESIAQQEG